MGAPYYYQVLGYSVVRYCPAGQPKKAQDLDTEMIYKGVSHAFEGSAKH